MVVARDGGTLSAMVKDRDGNAAPDIHVAIMPADAGSEGALADALVLGDTGQDGNCSQTALRPGNYLILATAQPVNTSFDTIAKLWAARSRAKKVELAPNGSVQVTLEPVGLE